MRRMLTAVVVIIVLLAGGVIAQQKKQQDIDLQAAIRTETVDGDLNGAIKQYSAIVSGYKADRAVTATALVRMADCYRKLGDAEARKLYERIVREFADQKDAAAEARARLAALQSPTPAHVSQAVRLVWTGQDAFGSVRGSISPDGRYLTFLHPGTGGLAVRDLRENTTRILAQGSGSLFYAAFSPDGRQVAYAWATQTGKNVQYDLRILPLAGGEAVQPRILYRNEEMAQIRPFGWTPDRAGVLVLRLLKDGTSQIAMVSMQDGSIRVLKSLTWNYTTMSLSPDGRSIAYDALSGDNTAPSEIFVLAADGSRETKVVQGPAVNASPLWAPDGSRLLFLSDRTGTLSLWMVPLADGTPSGPAELIKADTGRVRLQGITRTGTLLYLVSGALRSNVYTVELDASMKATRPPMPVSERFINSNSAPTWSPDGQRLAYLSSRGQRGTVLVIRTLATGEERDLSMPQGVGTGNLLPGPTWFPDGRSVLIKGGVANYYRVDLANGNAELLHAAKGIGGAGGLGANAVSADGKSIFYIANIDASGSTIVERRLVRFDIASRTETVLKSGQVFMALALSPDGTRLAYKSNTQEGCHIEVMRADGVEVREVFQGTQCGNPNQLAWSPDQRYLLFVKGQSTAPNVLWRVPVVGGQPEEIGVSMSGQLMYPHVHPDGRRITFGVFETGASEVWALENFLPKVQAAR